MTVGVNTEYNFLNRFAAEQTSAGVVSSADKTKSAEKLNKDTVEISKAADSAKKTKTDKKKYTFKTFIADVTSAWINFKEVTKGVFKGLFGGFIAASLIIFTDKTTSGLKAVKMLKQNPELIKENVKKLSKMGAAKDNVIKNIDAFKSAFAKGTTKGKVIAGVIGAAILTGYIIAARLRANLKTANVDHALHEGHRNK